MNASVRSLIRSERDLWARQGQTRLCAECGARFVPSKYRPDQRFCSDRCRNRAWQRDNRRAVVECEA